MAKQDYPFPEDEFDVLGADRVPRGVHRTPLPRWRSLLPFIVVLLLAPVLAYVGVSYLAGQGSSSADIVATASAEPTEPSAEETPEPEETAVEETPVEEAPTPEPTPEETPTPEPTDLARDSAVFLLNGTGVTGLAAEAASLLEADGFSSVSASNYSRSAPSVSTVYYNNADLLPTAEQVGAVLGIGNLVELASATDSIAVVLRGDFQP